MEKSRKVSFFQKYFCCGTQSDIQEPKTATNTYIKTTTISEYLNSNEKDPSLYSLYFVDGCYQDKVRKIKTEHPLKDLLISETLTEITHLSCPICFRYFNYILTSCCCINQICHICALEFQRSKCHFCLNEICTYNDADSTTQKIYTDSQGMQLIALKLQKH
ncbi:unnamed protein product (macronuclear) [Paramecium tetraurelia]|uniref:RING-type domain-containing protein n=1 Tax=Paramecium tetraurelia TaxID=5888 RepID=A0CFN2_PARTE|nr:uncharacterized protein GSPATT00038039001 [Paramecium tetraurelia]CAK69599.1 unnamed protein product [Paramecium tetraurelia]|eukprot:XP_001436996.1 hypothetical protein (macronuclear) [Paramecium tetraurelia strain d4-2]